MHWKTGAIALAAAVAAGGVFGQAAADDDTVVVGAAVALSGFIAPYDDPHKGAILAIEDINAKGGVLGKQIEFVTADTKSDPAQGANAAIEVMEQGAEIVLVTCDFGSPAAITAQSRGKIAFSLCAGVPKFGVQGIGDLAFSMGIGTPAEGAIMAEWAHAPGWTKPFIFKDTQVEYTKKLAGDTTYTSEWHINFDTPMMITQVQNGVRSGIGRFAAGKVPPVDF